MTREQLLNEIVDRANELALRRIAPTTARDALELAAGAATMDPLTGGKWRTSSMLRRCALDCAAWALLALEKLSEVA